jgi:hypothetical protein
MVQKDPKNLDVIAGTLNYKTGGTRSKVDKVFVHPKWGRSGTEFDYDGTLLKLSTSIAGVETLKPTAPDAALPPDGFRVRVSGWGATSEGGPVTDELRLADIPIISNADCNKPDSYGGRISTQMFCAGVQEGGLDSCQGDSGGPVMFDRNGSKELVGIVSWGDGCARKLKPGVYTRVSTISKWAADTMNGN